MSDKSESIFSAVPEMKYSAPVPQIDPKEFVKVVESRRSVRVYEPTPIPENTVRECLRLALLAPNSSNLQPWEFYWIRSEVKRKAIVHACFSQPAASTAAELFICVARTKTWNENRQRMLDFFSKQATPPPKSATDYYTKLVPLAYGIGPFGIFGFLKKISLWFVGLKTPVPREPSSPSEMKLWASKSAALACENLMLSFRAFGYDTCPMEGLDSTRVRKILSLPRDAVVVMGVSAGKRASNGVYGPQIRFDSSLFIKEV